MRKNRDGTSEGKGARSAAWIGLLAGGVLGAAASAWADFGDPLPGLSAAQRTLFEQGRTAFLQVEEPEDGLGPVFNEASCATCHITPAGVVGSGSERAETRFGRIRNSGEFEDMDAKGGSLLQDHSLGKIGPGCNFKTEMVPGNATITALRLTTPLFGLGLVEAVPEPAIRALAANQPPAIRGVASVVPDLGSDPPGQPALGRFGWKAQVPTLFQFAGDAYLNEMGITNPEFPDENCANGKCNKTDKCNPLPGLNDDGDDVELFAAFMTFLAPPPRGPITPDVTDGEAIFNSLGCAGCHVSTLHTRSGSGPLEGQTIHPFSDFLLHDMGNLGDGITQNNATGVRMRTAPLWGLRIRTALLHDGRAKNAAEAIREHRGQGAAARDAFKQLGNAQKKKLEAFLKSL